MRFPPLLSLVIAIFLLAFFLENIIGFFKWLYWNKRLFRKSDALTRFRKLR